MAVKNEFFGNYKILKLNVKNKKLTDRPTNLRHTKNIVIISSIFDPITPPSSPYFLANLSVHP